MLRIQKIKIMDLKSEDQHRREKRIGEELDRNNEEMKAN